MNYRMLIARTLSLIFALLIAMALSPHAIAHPELNVDAIDEQESKIDPKSGKPLFDVRPIWVPGFSPVHEGMLAESFNIANVYSRPWNDKAGPQSDDMSYMKGVYWNDSPERGLCFWCSWVDANVRAGKWAIRFKAAQKAAQSGTVFTHGSDVFERSHYGDLVFIHGMATKDGISAVETHKRMMIWAEFAYKVATGKIRALTKIKDVKIPGFDVVFNASDQDIFANDILHLFKDPNDGKMLIDAKRIALGSLMHMIQDSYSPAHIERENDDTKEGRFCRTTITRFLAYPNQIVSKHSAADKWPANLPHGILNGSSRVCDPITAGAAIMKFHARNNFNGADWPEVKDFLEKRVFPLSPNAQPSAPGTEYAK